jgi:hypothetical protein
VILRKTPRAASGLAWLSWVLLTACTPQPAPTPRPEGLQHLLATGATATLGSETRLCPGPGGTILLYGDFDSAAD